MSFTAFLCSQLESMGLPSFSFDTSHLGVIMLSIPLVCPGLASEELSCSSVLAALSEL